MPPTTSDPAPAPPDVLGRLSDGLVGLDLDCRYTYLNRPAERILGVDREKQIGEYAWRPDTVNSSARKQIEAAMATQQKRSFEHYNSELDQRFEVHVYPDEEGTTLYLTDITDPKRQEQAILRSMSRITSDQEASFESKIRQLLDLGREYLDLPYGFLTHISEDVQRIVQVAGTHHPLLAPDSTYPLSEAYCRKTIQKDRLLSVQDAPAEGWKGDPAYNRFSLDTYIGSRVVVAEELYGTFCFADDAARKHPFTKRERIFVELMTLWTSYELTQKRAQRQLEHQNERLDEFASIVSHDLRNPLNVARGRTALAQDKLDRDSQHLRKVRQALNRMETITRDTLLLARQGKTVEDTEPIAIAQLLDQCWEMVDTEDASLRVENAFPIQGDRDRLRHLFENLFRNAVEHGGADVTVRVGRRDANAFYVEDDGSGFSDEASDEIFRPGVTSSRNGSGMGLTIVRRVAEAHDWTVSATEGPDEGARFEFANVTIPQQES